MRLSSLDISMAWTICVLSQSYNATVFYFDNVSFLEHELNQLFLPNESSISQASYLIMVVTICFQLFKKQTIFGDSVVETKMKWMVMYQYPTCDMHCVHRKRCVDFWDFFRNSLHVKRKNVLQMFSFNSVARKVRLFTNTQEFLTLLHERSFRQFQNLSDLGPCRWKFDRIMLRSISKQRK